MILHTSLLAASEAATRDVVAWAYVLCRVADQIGAIRKEVSMAKEADMMETGVAGIVAFAKDDLDKAISYLKSGYRESALLCIDSARGSLTAIK